jgi:hypothetical protein
MWDSRRVTSREFLKTVSHALQQCQGERSGFGTRTSLLKNQNAPRAFLAVLFHVFYKKRIGLFTEPDRAMHTGNGDLIIPKLGGQGEQIVAQLY